MPAGAALLSQCKNYSLGTRRKAGIEYPPFCTGCHLSRDFSRSASCRLLALRNCTHQRLPAWRRFRRPPWGLTPSFHPLPGRWAQWMSPTAPTSPAGLLSVALGLVATLRSRRPTLLFRWVSLLRAPRPSVAARKGCREVPLIRSSRTSDTWTPATFRTRSANFSGPTRVRRSEKWVPKGRFELPRANAHYALNVARLPIPPLRPKMTTSAG